MAKAQRDPIRHSGEMSLDIYLRDIHNTPLLTREEECALARRLRAGDKDALDKLVRSNLRFVVSIAKQYAGQGLGLPDLINEGNLGLIKAAHRFDETRGFKFISYAVWWVRQTMLQDLAEQSRQFRIPLNRANVLYRLGKVQQRLYQHLEREPTVEEIAEQLKISRQEAKRTMALTQTPLSLSEGPREDDDNRLEDYLSDDEAAQSDESTWEKALHADLRHLLGELDERQQVVMRRYYGIDREERETLEQIGHHLGLTRERIRQIKEECLAKLRNSPRGRAMADYLE